MSKGRKTKRVSFCFPVAGLTCNDVPRYWTRHGNKTEIVSNTYDEAGDLKSSTNNGVAIHYNSPGGVYTPNPYGLTTGVKRTFGSNVLTTGFQYDQHLQLTGVTSPDTAIGAQSVSYGYNALGHLRTMPGWINGNVAYDAFGRFTGFTLANNVQKSVSYNDQDQLIGLKYSTASGPDLKSYAFTYDQASNVIGKKVDAHASNSYSYDALNQLVGANEKGWFQQKPESLDVAYSAVDRDYIGTKVMDFTVSPVLSTSTLKLDMASRSVGVDLKAVYGVNKIELHPQSTTHRVKKADITVYASTSNLSPTDYQKITGWTFVQSADGSLVLSFPTIFQARYIKINTIWDDRDVANKTVDRAQFFNTAAELVKVWALTTSQDQAFTYDKNGNRTVLSIDTKPQDYAYYRTPDNTGNLSWVRSDGQWYYQYDQAGNTIVKAKALVTTANVEGPDTSKEYWTYEWDLHNRLSSVKKNGQQMVSYVYDTLNYRVQRTGTDGTTIYTYGRNGALLYQKNLTTGLTRTLAYLNDTIIGWTETVGGVTTRYYANTDELGSVTQVVSDNASNPTVLWQSEYTAFGVLAGAEGSMSFAGMFTGKDIDPDTGLTYHWNRWRSEDGSRFWSEDPARDGANWYGYAGNSPLVFTDPTGLTKWGKGDTSGGGSSKAGSKAGAKSGTSPGSGSASGSSKSGSKKDSSKTGSVGNGGPSSSNKNKKGVDKDGFPRSDPHHNLGSVGSDGVYRAYQMGPYKGGEQSTSAPSDGGSPDSSGVPVRADPGTNANMGSTPLVRNDEGGRSGGGKLVLNQLIKPVGPSRYPSINTQEIPEWAREIMRDTVVAEAFTRAWRLSNPHVLPDFSHYVRNKDGSFTPIPNPEKNELGFWIVKLNGKYAVEWRQGYGNQTDPGEIPKGAVAFAHVHPFQDGTDEPSGPDLYYRGISGFPGIVRGFKGYYFY